MSIIMCLDMSLYMSIGPICLARRRILLLQLLLFGGNAPHITRCEAINRRRGWSTFLGMQHKTFQVPLSQRLLIVFCLLTVDCSVKTVEVFATLFDELTISH
jgi:hypothetical protein